MEGIRAITHGAFVYMKYILATKEHMTQIFDEDGVVHVGTVLKAGPVTVTQVKTTEKDGYQAVQVGYGFKRPALVTKPMKGHLKELGSFRYLREFPVTEGAEVGQTTDVSAFAAGDKVVVAGISKGKGFQGVVKRHGFHGGPRTHGQKHSEREPGSIGGGLRTRVPKGMRMAGRMGSDRVSVKGLKVLHVDPKTNTIIISGAVPGRRGTLIEITAQ